MIERVFAPLSRNARSLLEQERAALPAGEAQRQRLVERARAALEDSSVAPANAGDRASGIALRADEIDSAQRRRRARRLGATLLVAAVLAVAGLAAARIGMFQRRPSRALTPSQPVPAARLSPHVSASVAQVAAAPPSVVAALAEAVPHPNPTPTDAAHASNASTYALELGLLEPARKSIARGDFGAALSAISRHQREYPHSQLAEEREALRVRALWGMGQSGAAERAAAAFRKRYPRSALLSWMKAEAAPL